MGTVFVAFSEKHNYAATAAVIAACSAGASMATAFESHKKAALPDNSGRAA